MTAQWINRLNCRLGGHDWRFIDILDMAGNRLFECRRCGASEWRHPRRNPTVVVREPLRKRL